MNSTAIEGRISFSTISRLAAWRATQLADGATVDALLRAVVAAGGLADEKGGELSLVLAAESGAGAAWVHRIEPAWSLPGARSASITVADVHGPSVRSFHGKLGKKKNVWADSPPGEAAFLSRFLCDQAAKQLAKSAPRASLPGPPARATAPTPSGNSKRLAVVDEIIAKVRKKKTSKPGPVATAALAQLDLGPGKPLSPCLARWLAFDGAWVGLDPAHPSFVAMRPSEIAREHLDLPPELVTRFAAAVDALLPADCFYLGNGSSGPCFLYAGVPDADGEYPIFYIDADEAPVVFIAFPGFDYYLCDMLGGPDREQERRKLQRVHERANLGKLERIDTW